jgi:hypothetical protein
MRRTDDGWEFVAVGAARERASLQEWLRLLCDEDRETLSRDLSVNPTMLSARGINF